MAALVLVSAVTAMPVSDADSEAEAQRGPIYKETPIYKEAPRPARKAAGPPAYGPPAPVYAPGPKYAPKPEAKLPPQPYQFEYGVADQYTGTNFQAVENQDAEGTVIGK